MEIKDIRERAERLHIKRLLEAEAREATKGAVAEDATGAGGEHANKPKAVPPTHCILQIWWAIPRHNTTRALA